MKLLLIATLLVVSVPSALAGDHRYGSFPAPYIEECASCHVAYPPQLLTAEGWQTVMAQLGKHYGVDASLDAKHRGTLADFLQRAASRKGKHAPTESTARMTKTAWFVHEHGSMPPTKMKFADCAACHTAANKGDYSERSLKLPAGFRHKERD